MNSMFWKGAAAVWALWSSVAFAADEVKLQEVVSTVSSSPGPSRQQVHLEAVVKNLAFAKDVVMHYQSAAGPWVDVPLTYSRQADDGREIWSAQWSPPPGTTVDLQFALRYSAAGETHWDNNNGHNFFMAPDSGVRLFDGVNVRNLFFAPAVHRSRADTHLLGAVAVRHLAVEKVVNVRYTTDRWATSRTAVATYSPSYWEGIGSSAQNPNPHGIEVWSFQLDVGSSSEVEYAIEYVVNGASHWDNNFGRNYRTVIHRQ